jgi:hypothetical protein
MGVVGSPDQNILRAEGAADSVCIQLPPPSVAREVRTSVVGFFGR